MPKSRMTALQFLIHVMILIIYELNDFIKYMEILTIQQLWERIERAEAMANERVNADTKEQQVTNNEKKGEQQ